MPAVRRPSHRQISCASLGFSDAAGRSVDRIEKGIPLLELRSAILAQRETTKRHAERRIKET
jgi:hypothetical protein